MRILLDPQEELLLQNAGIPYSAEKEYSDNDALDLLDAVRELEVLHSQYDRGAGSDLYAQYCLIADHIYAQIPEN